MVQEFVWYKKYQPKTFEEYVFKDEDLKNRFLEYKNKKDMPNVLLAGSPGSGKSSLARVLLNELGIREIDTLILNGTTIKQETLREEGEVVKFCSSMPNSSPFRIVIFEEFDRGSKGQNALIQDSMRYIIDRFSDDVRFIFTCNYLTKVSEPVQSRCEVFEFKDQDFEEVGNLCADILVKEGVEVDDIDVLFQHLSQYYPDVRKTLVSIQKSVVDGKLYPPQKSTGGVTEAIEEWRGVWYSNGIDNLTALLQLTEHINQENKDEFYRVVYENVDKLPEDRREKAVVACADHLYRSAFVADQQMLMDSLLYTIKYDL